MSSYDKVLNGNTVAENNAIINSNFAKLASSSGSSGSTGTTVGTPVFYIEGNTSGTTGVWTGTDSNITEYYDGLAILYKIGISGSTITTLNINDLGAITVRRNTGNMTNQLPVNTVVLLTYTTISDTGYFVWADYYINTDTDILAYQIRKNYNGYRTKTYLYKYQILVTVDEQYLIPLNTSNGVTATTKAMTTQEFNPYAPIYYYNYTATVSSGNVITYQYLFTQLLCDVRFALNCGANLTNYKALYLVCKPTTGCLCQLATDVNHWSQTLPTTEDGYLYVYLGQSYSSYQIELAPVHPVFFFKDGELQVGSPSTSTSGSGEKGEKGDKGDKGDDGYSPTIEVAVNTSTEYKLEVTTADGSFTTPNLKGTSTSSGDVDLSGINSVHYIEGNTSGTAGTWTGTDDTISDYYDGLVVAYKIGIAGGSSSTTLNINDLGAITVRRNAGNLTTQLPVNTVVLLTYTTISSTGYFVWADYYVNNAYCYQVREQAGAYSAKSTIYKYKLLFTVDEGYLTPLNNDNYGISDTTKTMTTQEFNPYASIYWYNSGTTVSANSIIPSAYTLYEKVIFELGYSVNLTTKLTTNRAVYLVCQPTTGCMCKLATDVACYTQTLPTTEDGYIYVYLGQASSSTQVELSLSHPVYYYKNGALRIGSPNS